MDFNLHHPTTQPSSERKIKHYSNFHQILLVGEGDFSFSLALANAFGSAKNMVPTSLDSRDKVESSYKSGKKTLQRLERFGAMTLHGVDATTIDKFVSIRKMKFDRIVYNFPHAGFFGKEEDERVIKKHRHLLKMFFKHARIMLSGMGEIHVSHKECYPYNEWKLVEQAEKWGLVVKESVKFNRADYPGYTNRRGAGPNIGDTFNLGNCRTYMFIKRESIATTSLLPNISPKAHAESFETAILEIEFELQARKATVTTKLKWEASLSHLKTLSAEVINENEEYKIQRDDALCQKDEAWREKENTVKQLTYALSLKDHAIKQKEMSLEKVLSELEFERQALKVAESRKAVLEASFNNYKLSVCKELKKMNEIVRQRDDALYQKQEVCREREIIAKQLDEALSLKDHAIKQKEVSLEKLLSELEFERQALKVAETRKTVLEASFNNYKLSVCKELKKMNEIVRQRDDALYQKQEVCREREIIAKQLDEALSLKDHAIKQKEVSLEKLLSELEFERQALKVAEMRKTVLEASFNNYKLSVCKELKKMNEIVRQRDDALYQKQEVCREREIIAKQLDEALSLQKSKAV